MLPFAVLIATFGVQSVLERAEPRLAAGHCVPASRSCPSIRPVSIANLHDRRIGAAPPVGSIGGGGGTSVGAMEAVIAHEPDGSPRPVYRGSDIAWADSYWIGVRAQAGRSDLIPLVAVLRP